MKKIKPVVSHYVKVTRSGGLAFAMWNRRELIFASRSKYHAHQNGKCKFRPVYDYTVSHEVEKQNEKN